MIISASRRTDIPAFYGSWLFNRLQQGFVLVPNPRNPHQMSYVSLSPDVVDCFVFWTKNPAAMINRLSNLSPYNFYFQFTLTGYQRDIEPHLPSLAKRIAIFKRLAEKIDSKRIVWRYDPILINDQYTIDYHIECFNKIAAELCGYTDTCTISFIDDYRHIRKSLAEKNIYCLDTNTILKICPELSKIANSHQIMLQTCAEEIDLTAYNISHGACIDKTRIEKITGLSLSAKFDKNQRKACNCVESIDIGTYNTCSFGCIYCYASTAKKTILFNKQQHDKNSSMLVGKPRKTEIIQPKTLQSLLTKQNRLF